MTELLKTHPFFVDKNLESCMLLENQGYCNENYVVVADGVKYIVRKLLRDDINREFEWKVQNLAFKEKITAKPLMFDRESEFMVFEFLEGEHRQKLDLFSLYTLVDSVSRLHDNVLIDGNIIEAKDLIKIRNKEIMDALETIDFYTNYTEDFVLCHNDLNPMNILWQDNKPMLLDFEYAGMNDCYFDLATISIEFNLDKKEESLMLHRYFGNTFFREKFEAYKVIYKTLCDEWFQNNL